MSVHLDPRFVVYISLSPPSPIMNRKSAINRCLSVSRNELTARKARVNW